MKSMKDNEVWVFWSELIGGTLIPERFCGSGGYVINKAIEIYTI